MNWITILAPIAGICALLFAYFLIIRIKRMDPGTERMKEIAANIHSGAMAFLKRTVQNFGHLYSRYHCCDFCCWFGYPRFR